jgi:tetratricopeptide (TPR) repeat protein
MAEGLLGGILGAEAEKPEVEAPETLAHAEAFAAAVVAMASRQDPEVARKTGIFLDHQSELLQIQAQHLKDEHSLRVGMLRGQRVGQAFRIGFQLFLVVVATAIGIVFATMVHSAATARGVVVDAFQVPQDLTQRGLTGQVIAQQVLDRLFDMQTATSLRSARPASSYGSNWGSELKVEVPETGVSFGELSRYLHETLGRETHISGEVYATSSGMKVTARTGAEASNSFVGPTEELDQLVRRAAESIYGQTQPYRYANFLFRDGRWDEARPILKRLALEPNHVERAWAHLLVGSFAQEGEHDFVADVAEIRAALVELPGLLRAKEYLAYAESYLGHDAVVVEIATQCLSADADSRETIAPEWLEFVKAHCLFQRSVAEGDYGEALRQASSQSVLNRQTLGFRYGTGWVASAQLLTHDLDAAMTYDWDAIAPSARIYSEQVTRVAAARDAVAGAVAFERGDARAVELWAAASANEDHPATAASHDFMLRNSGSWLALAKARFGDVPGGQALIASTPMDCRICVDLRGRIAALAGDAAQAEKWFAEAIAMAPKLPQAYTDRGQARLDRGDIAGALADATQAATLSENNGDAWKLWGDVLTKQRLGKEALVKYDKALKYAPNWKQLQEAREAVAGEVVQAT